MKKGITPIIAVIILLLITVALAGFAWSFLSGYVGGLAGKNIQVADSYCISGTQAKVVLRNVGTEGISLGTCTSDGSITGTEKSCEDITAVRTDIGGSMYGKLSASGTINPQGSFTFTDDNCTQTGTSKICTYRLRSGSAGVGPSIVSVSCPG